MERINVPDLISIIKNSPISVRDVIKLYNVKTGEVSFLYGIAEKMPWRKVGLGYLVDNEMLNEWGIGLSAYCDDIVDTMLHETCHAYRGIYNIDKEDVDIDEHETNKMVKYIKENYHNVVKEAQNRVIYELGKRGY